MTFTQIKCAALSIILGAVVATTSYLLSTASYVGSSTGMILTPKTSDAGTQWLAENDEVAVEVRYITSLIETPIITIRKKQQWRKLAVCMSAGIVLAYLSYLLLMRKARSKSPEVITTAASGAENIIIDTASTPSENSRHDPV